MTENTKIEWANHTFNPWIGCSKVHTGCEHCYAEASQDRRFGRVKWGPHGTRSMTSRTYWRQPIKWNRQGILEHARQLEPAPRPRVFCGSLCDVFDDWEGCITNNSGNTLAMCFECSTIRPFGGGALPPHCADCDTGNCRPAKLSDLRRDLFRLIDATPHLNWLLLTKRPENVSRLWPPVPPVQQVPEAGEAGFITRRNNVWLGTSVSDQETADRMIPALLKCRDLVPVLFVSVEPLLSPIYLENCLDDRPYLDWIIVGGESGPDARPMHPDWVRSIRDQCQAGASAGHGVPFFFKQWGEWLPECQDDFIPDGTITSRDGRVITLADFPMVRVADETAGVNYASVFRVGKKAAGRLLDGVEWNEVPMPT